MIELHTITKCDNDYDALWQNLVLSNIRKDERGIRLEYLKIRSLLGVRDEACRLMLESNRNCITWTKNTRTGNRSYSTGVVGRATEYKIIKTGTNIYRLTDEKMIKRYLAFIDRGSKVISSRLTESIKHQIECLKRLSIDEAEISKFRNCDKDQDAIKALRLSIEKAQHGKIPVVDAQEKVYSPLTEINKLVRCAVLFDGKKTTTIDMVSAHKSLSFLYASRNWKLPKDEIKALRNLDVKHIKHDFNAWLNDPRGGLNYANVEEWIQEVAPTYYKHFVEYRMFLGPTASRSCMYKIYNQLESDIMNDLIKTIMGSRYRKSFVGRIHDCVMVLDSNKKAILKMLNKRLEETGDGFIKMAVKDSQIERTEKIKKEKKKMITKIVDMSGYKRPGRSWTQEKKDAWTEFKSKAYTFQTYTGEIIEIFNLKAFCKNNKLNRSAMHKVVSGKLKAYKGFKLPSAGSTSPLQAPVAPQLVVQVVQASEPAIEAPCTTQSLDDIMEQAHKADLKSKGIVVVKPAKKLLKITKDVKDELRAVLKRYPATSAHTLYQGVQGCKRYEGLQEYCEELKMLFETEENEENV